MSKNRHISALIDKSKLAYEARGLIERHTPKSVSDHCVAINFQRNQVTIHVSNSSSLTHLRFLVPTLLTEFKKSGNFHDIKRIKLKISTDSSGLKRKPGQDKRLSDQNRSLILENAQQMEEGPLKRALLKLAERK